MHLHSRATCASITHTMDEATVIDLKQFIATTMRQEVSGLEIRMDGLEQRMDDIYQDLSGKIDDLSASVADALDASNEATGFTT